MGRGPGFFEPSLCCCKAEHLLGPQSQNNSSFSRFKCSTNIKMSSDILERRSVISYRHELSDLQNHLSFMELENRNIWKIWIEEYWQNYICKVDLLAVLNREGCPDFSHLCVCAKSLRLFPTLCNSMDWSLPGSSVRGIFQARILEWVAMPSSRRSSQPRDQTRVCISRWVLCH